MSVSPQTKSGLFYAISAFVFWGLVPIYFKAVVTISEFEVLSHRVIWSVVFLLAFLVLSKQWQTINLRPRKRYFPYLLSALLVSFNWFVFIWAVGQERILETSLGYFINPLVSVLLGMLFLKERLRLIQAIAVSLALIGVCNQIWFVGSLPWVAISLALSFACYGLVRKVYPIAAAPGLLIETCFMLPFALAYLAWASHSGSMMFTQSGIKFDLLLIFAGIVTSVPLLLFAAGTHRLDLNVLGMTQYITPTLSFLLAIYLYHEPFDQAQLITFIWIWAGLILFTLEGIKHNRSSKKLALETEATSV
jgi:chloramphenicol-sensitive protein RarD